MKCGYCGFENSDEFKFCQNCGNPLAVQQESATEPEFISPNGDTYTAEAEPIKPFGVSDMILSALRDNLFFVVCILMTVVAGTGFLSGSVPVLQVLYTIFLWLCYAEASKGIASANHLRNISGTVYASYVILNVASVIIGICGVIIALILGLVGSNQMLIDEITDAFQSSGLNITMPDWLLSVSGVAVGVIFVIVAAIMILINILIYKNLHRFAQSVYRSVEAEQNMIVKADFACVCLIVLGILTAVSALSTFGAAQIMAGISNAASAALMIICGILIKKHITAGV